MPIRNLRLSLVKNCICQFTPTCRAYKSILGEFFYSLGALMFGVQQPPLRRIPETIRQRLVGHLGC